MISEEDARGARYSDLFGAERHEHTSDCAYCPICATIALVRNTKPELLEHLAAAARELVLAAGILLDEAGDVIGKEGGASKPAEDGKVRRIDIS